jgi:bifunctional enzyme CysN/CysC
VDDGKSTLLGRMLHDAGLIPDDQLAALALESRRRGAPEGELEYSLLLDGLGAEREQGITIDVAYRFFATERRKFIVADAPGHEQYTRNMVTGASTAEVAVVLVDARKGLLPQTRRHTQLVALLGVRRAVLAVNKMDLVDHSREVFRRVEAEFSLFARRLGLEEVAAVPLSALHGDNVVKRSARMPWYPGPTLLEHLETVPGDDDLAARPFRMPVQWVSRSGDGFRGYAGTIASGRVAPGERVRLLPSGRESRVTRIVTAGGDLPEAVAGQSVTLALADDVDVARGDVIAVADDPPQVGRQFEATLVWMGDAPLLPGRDYLMKLGTRTATATVAPLKYRLDVETEGRVAATSLRANEIGVCEVELDRPVVFEPYERSRDLGGFLLIDRLSSETVGAGLLRFALRRSQNVHWQPIDVGRAARAALKGQKPCVVWFTGLPASGKSTIANAVERRLHAMGRHTYLLDGDNVRHGLCKDLGFTEAARVENIRRVAEVAALMADAGLVVLTAFISPFRSERRMARGLLAAGDFLEVFVDTPLAVAEARDPKGLYRKARRGELANFTGVDSPYERPERAEVTIDGAALSPEDAAERVVEEMRRRGL